MTGGIDEDGYIVKGHISNQTELLKGDSNLTSSHKRYLQMSQASSLVGRLRHPLNHKKKQNPYDVRLHSQPIDLSPRAAYRDVGAGSTLLSRQSATATTIQKFRRVHTGARQFAASTSAKSTQESTDNYHGNERGSTNNTEHRKDRKLKNEGLGQATGRPQSFDKEDQRRANGTTTFVAFENPLDEWETP